jgi:predicted nuclease of predicted toxin-antitoxin system
MKLLVNENIPAAVIQALRGLHHDVLSVKECMQGATDVAILDRAQDEGCVVVTQDKDFGELAFGRALPAECGIVLFRLSGTSPAADLARMVEVIESRTDWYGTFAVASDDRIRVRDLPGGKSIKPR